MDSMVLAGTLGIFGDHVYSSTDLNRRHAEVLNSARKWPVTISRHNEQFALMNREYAASLMKALASMSKTIELLQSVFSLLEENEIAAPHAWLSVLDHTDLRQFVTDLIEATDKAVAGVENWDFVETVMHEWYESALVIESGVIEKALSSERNEVPLTNPEVILAKQEAAERAATTS